MDRAYWYYRTIANFPGAVWQQPMVGFAALASAPHATNQFAERSRRDRGGASGAAGMGASPAPERRLRRVVPQRALGTARRRSPRPVRSSRSICWPARSIPPLAAHALDAARRAGEWLWPRYNAGVMNQNLASAVALAGLAHLDGGGSHWRARATRLLQRVAGDQSSEGWFPEYGGFDFGYSTLALDSTGADRTVWVCGAGRADGRTAGAVPVGRAGSRLRGSRPSGQPWHGARLPVWRSGAVAAAAGGAGAGGRSRAAAFVGVGVRAGGRRRSLLCLLLLSRFCLAYHAAASAGISPAADASHRRTVERPASGLVVWRRGGATIVVNRRLGGAAAMLRVAVPALYHLGYTVTIGGARYSSAGWRRRCAGRASPRARRAPRHRSARCRAGCPCAGSPYRSRSWCTRWSGAGWRKRSSALVKRRMIHPARDDSVDA